MSRKSKLRASATRGPLAPAVAEISEAIATYNRLRAERDAKISRIIEKFNAAIPNCNALVDAYNEDRVDLFMAALSERGLDVCVMCTQAKRNVRLYMITSRRHMSSSDCSYNTNRWIQDTRVLQKLCRKCATILSKPLSIADADKDPNREFCNVERAKHEHGRLRIKRDGRWQDEPLDVRLEPAYPELDTIPPKLAKRFGIPPYLQMHGERIQTEWPVSVIRSAEIIDEARNVSIPLLAPSKTP